MSASNSSVQMHPVSMIMSLYNLVAARYVQSLLCHCTEKITVVLHFICTGCWASMMAVRDDELTVASGLICVKLVMSHWRLNRCGHLQGRGWGYSSRLRGAAPFGRWTNAVVVLLISDNCKTCTSEYSK